MQDNQTIEILKQAILLERRGKAFYSSVAKQSTDDDVKNFFELMAKEEDEHVQFLTEQSASYFKSLTFQADYLPEPEAPIAEQILTESIRKKISASSFEAAAIQSAIDMEKRAIAVYASRAESAEDPAEQKFYAWLASWEEGHLKLLSKIDNELKEEVWQDNNFWPF
ncbi:MAG: hypothetical protein RIS47_1600 [Bacteroidota bacterium]